MEHSWGFLSDIYHALTTVYHAWVFWEVKKTGVGKKMDWKIYLELTEFDLDINI